MRHALSLGISFGGRFDVRYAEQASLEQLKSTADLVEPGVREDDTTQRARQKKWSVLHIRPAYTACAFAGVQQVVTTVTHNIPHESREVCLPKGIGGSGGVSMIHTGERYGLTQRSVSVVELLITPMSMRWLTVDKLFAFHSLLAFIYTLKFICTPLSAQHKVFSSLTVEALVSRILEEK